jgi:hypothetical protein
LPIARAEFFWQRSLLRSRLQLLFNSLSDGAPKPLFACFCRCGVHITVARKQGDGAYSESGTRKRTCRDSFPGGFLINGACISAREHMLWPNIREKLFESATQ